MMMAGFDGPWDTGLAGRKSQVKVVELGKSQKQSQNRAGMLRVGKLSAKPTCLLGKRRGNSQQCVITHLS
jgi:hypothetical protein